MRPWQQLAHARHELEWEERVVALQEDPEPVARGGRLLFGVVRDPGLEARDRGVLRARVDRARDALAQLVLAHLRVVARRDRAERAAVVRPELLGKGVEDRRGGEAVGSFEDLRD